MPRTRSRQPKQSGAADGVGTTAQELPADLDELDPQTAIAELGPEAQLVTLYRRDPTAPSQFAYLASFPADGFTLDTIRAEYGGGVYRLHVRNGARQVRKQFGFAIAGSPKMPSLNPPLSDTSPTPRASSPELQEMRDAIKAMGELVKTLAASQVRPAADPMQQAVQLAGLLQAAQTAGAAQLREIMDASGGKKGGALSVQDMRELVQEGIRLGEERAGNGPAADPLLTLAEKLGPPLLGLIERGLEQERGARGVAAPGGLQPGVVGHIPAGPQPPAPGGEVSQTLPAWAARIRPHIGALVWMARAGADPEPIADTIAQALQGADAEQLAALLTQDDALAQVLQVAPELAPYEGWAGRLLGELADKWGIGDPNSDGDDAPDTSPATPATA